MDIGQQADERHAPHVVEVTVVTEIIATMITILIRLGQITRQEVVEVAEAAVGVEV